MACLSPRIYWLKLFFLKLDKTGLFKVEVVAEPGIHKAIKGALCPMYGRDLGKR
jgi:hypothetical protein